MNENLYIPVPESGCWIWLGKTIGDNGYGYFEDRGRILAHRFSWEDHFGPIPDGLYVLHKCDTPSCINPYHLFLGTYRDNARDRDAKGRGKIPDNKGEDNGMVVLTEAQVKEIYKDCRPQRIVAADYGISQSTVSAIKTRRRWGWLHEQSH